jgi:hypothetical protein
MDDAQRDYGAAEIDGPDGGGVPPYDGDGDRSHRTGVSYRFLLFSFLFFSGGVVWGCASPCAGRATWETKESLR